MNMEALTKWIGSKGKYLEEILPLIPRDVKRYYEPFVGGGSMFLAMPEVERYIIGQPCKELMTMYREAQQAEPDFMGHLRNFNAAWKNIAKQCQKHSAELRKLYADFPEGKNYDYLEYVHTLNPLLEQISYDAVFPANYGQKVLFEMEKRHHFTTRKTQSIGHKLKTPEALDKFILTSQKAAVYEYLMELFNLGGMNRALKSAVLLFLLEFSSNGQYALDEDGEFRPSYGGSLQNDRSLDRAINLIEGQEFRTRMDKTEFHALEMGSLFMKIRPQKDDFLLVDPPIGRLERKVGANTFSAGDMEVVLNLLEGCKGRWMLLVKKVDMSSRLSVMLLDHYSQPLGPEKELFAIMNYDPEKQ